MKSKLDFRFLHFIILITLLLPGCAGAAQAIAPEGPAVSESREDAESPWGDAANPAAAESLVDARPQRSTPTVSPLNALQAGAVFPTPRGVDSLSLPEPAATSKAGQPNPLPNPTRTPTPAPRSAASQSLENWQQWPVLPAAVSDELREIYRQGLARGNDSHAFSILGDCQSQPDVFMGIYDSDPAFVRGLPPALQETVGQFQGSFDRYSPTVKDGTTEGALLWGQWNDNQEKKCNPGESPIDCELRVHRPVIVFIHVGTHWEARNYHYLTIVIEKILASKAVPVLVTKADNRELDARVNRNLVTLAAEYNLPLWNFWASVQHLPENGMQPGSNKYLSDAGLVIHRRGALEALEVVWRSLQ